MGFKWEVGSWLLLKVVIRIRAFHQFVFIADFGIDAYVQWDCPSVSMYSNC